MNEIESENNSTTIEPIPNYLYRGFMESASKLTSGADHEGSSALPARTSGERVPDAPRKSKAKA